jgi:hypothetical protein
MDEATFTNTGVYFFLVQLIRQINLPLYLRIESIINGISNLSADSLEDIAFATRVLAGITLEEDITPLIETMPSVQILSGGKRKQRGGNPQAINLYVPSASLEELQKTIITIPDINGIVLLLYFMTMTLKKRFFGSKPSAPKLFIELSQRIPILLMEEFTSRGISNTKNVAQLSRKTLQFVKLTNKVRDLNSYVRQTFLPGLFEYTEKTLDMETVSEESIQKLVSTLEQYKTSKNISGIIPALVNIREQAQPIVTNSNTLNTRINRNTTRRNAIRAQLKVLQNKKLARNIGKTAYTRKVTKLQRQLRRAEKALREEPLNYNTAVAKAYEEWPVHEYPANATSNYVLVSGAPLSALSPSLTTPPQALPVSATRHPSPPARRISANNKSKIRFINSNGNLERISLSELPATAAKFEAPLLDSLVTHIGMSLVHLNRTELSGFFLTDSHKNIQIDRMINIGARTSVGQQMFSNGMPQNHICNWHLHPHMIDRLSSPPSDADLFSTLVLKLQGGQENGCVMTPEGLYLYRPQDELLETYLNTYVKYGKTEPATWEAFDESLRSKINSDVNYIFEKITHTPRRSSGKVTLYSRLGKFSFKDIKVKVAFDVRFIPMKDLYSGIYIDFGSVDKTLPVETTYLTTNRYEYMEQAFQIDTVVSPSTGLPEFKVNFDVPLARVPPKFIQDIYRNSTKIVEFQESLLNGKAGRLPLRHLEVLQKENPLLEPFQKHMSLNQSIFENTRTGNIVRFPLTLDGKPSLNLQQKYLER